MADVRLIDANALAKWLDKEHYVDRPAGKCDERQNRVLGIAISALKNPQIAPTIDAVEVVRCRECKHRGYDACPMCHDEYYYDEDDGGDWVTHDKTEDDGFCHMGAKMDAKEG